MSHAREGFTNVAGKSRLAIDLVHEALRRGGVDAETTIATWKDVTAGLGDGRFDGSAAIWRSPDREKFLLFSKPYLETAWCLSVRRGSDVSAPRLDAFAGRRVAVVEQYAYGDAVEGAEGPRFIQGQSDQENLTKLLGGDVDCMLVDDLLMRYLVSNSTRKLGGAWRRTRARSRRRRATPSWQAYPPDPRGSRFESGTGSMAPRGSPMRAPSPARSTSRAGAGISGQQAPTLGLASREGACSTRSGSRP